MPISRHFNMYKYYLWSQTSGICESSGTSYYLIFVSRSTWTDSFSCYKYLVTTSKITILPKILLCIEERSCKINSIMTWPPVHKSIWKSMNSIMIQKKISIGISCSYCGVYFNGKSGSCSNKDIRKYVFCDTFITSFQNGVGIFTILKTCSDLKLLFVSSDTIKIGAFHFRVKRELLCSRKSYFLIHKSLVCYYISTIMYFKTISRIWVSSTLLFIEVKLTRKR